MAVVLSTDPLLANITSCVENFGVTAKFLQGVTKCEKEVDVMSPGVSFNLESGSPSTFLVQLTVVVGFCVASQVSCDIFEQELATIPDLL